MYLVETAKLLFVALLQMDAFARAFAPALPGGAAGPGSVGELALLPPSAGSPRGNPGRLADMPALGFKNQEELADAASETLVNRDGVGSLVLEEETYLAKLSPMETDPDTSLEGSQAKERHVAMTRTGADEALGPIKLAAPSAVELTLDVRGLSEKISKALSAAPKKPVSLHSALSTLWVGALVVALLPLFHPGFDDAGFPRLFMMEHITESTVTAFRAVTFSTFVISLLGQFRIPRRAPAYRRKFFTSITFCCLALWAFGDSNIAGDVTNYTLDVWSPMGKWTIMCCWFPCIISLLVNIEEVIAGSPKGRDSVPFGESVAASVALNLVFLWLNYLLFLSFAGTFLPYEYYAEKVLPFFQDGAGLLTRFGLVGGLIGNAQMAFGALIATLQFERKLTKVQAGAAAAASILVFYLDQVPLLPFFAEREAVSEVYALGLQEFLNTADGTFHITEIFLGAVAWTLVYSYGRVISKEKETGELMLRE